MANSREHCVDALLCSVGGAPFPCVAHQVHHELSLLMNIISLRSLVEVGVIGLRHPSSTTRVVDQDTLLMPTTIEHIWCCLWTIHIQPHNAPSVARRRFEVATKEGDNVFLSIRRFGGS